MIWVTASSISTKKKNGNIKNEVTHESMISIVDLKMEQLLMEKERYNYKRKMDEIQMKNIQVQMKKIGGKTKMDGILMKN